MHLPAATWSQGLSLHQTSSWQDWHPAPCPLSLLAEIRDCSDADSSCTSPASWPQSMNAHFFITCLSSQLQQAIQSRHAACSRGPTLESFVVTSLVQLLSRMTKLCW